VTNDDIAKKYGIITEEVVILISIMNAFCLIEQINLHREKAKYDRPFRISSSVDQQPDLDVDVKQLIQEIVYKGELNRPDLQREMRHTLTVYMSRPNEDKEEIGTLVFYDQHPLLNR